MSKEKNPITFPDETKLKRVLDPKQLVVGDKYLLFDGNEWKHKEGQFSNGFYYRSLEHPIGMETIPDDEVEDWMDDHGYTGDDVFAMHEFLIFCKKDGSPLYPELKQNEMFCHSFPNLKIQAELEKIKKMDGLSRELLAMKVNRDNVYDMTYNDVMEISPNYKAKRFFVREFDERNPNPPPYNESNPVFIGLFDKNDKKRIYKPQKQRITENWAVENIANIFHLPDPEVRDEIRSSIRKGGTKSRKSKKSKKSRKSKKSKKSKK